MNKLSNYHFGAVRKVPKCNENRIVISTYYPLCLGEDYTHIYNPPDDYLCMHPTDWNMVFCEKCLALKKQQEEVK